MKPRRTHYLCVESEDDDPKVGLARGHAVNAGDKESSIIYEAEERTA